MPMNEEAELSKEQQIMRAMRKTLTSIVREATPRDGNANPFSPSTVENIRMCLGLISAREAELAETMNLSRHERPFYSDDEPNIKTMNFVPPSKKLH
jgi:hypothetical protein